jgi:hypothetical protein
MPDNFANHAKGLESPASVAFAITPNDSTDLSQDTRGIYVGGDGNLVARINGADITFTGVKGGAVYPIRVSRVLATGTTATGLVGLA